MYKPTDLFDFSQSEHASIFDGCNYAWEALPKIKEYIAANLRKQLNNTCIGRAYIGEEVFIGEGTVVEDGVMIKGPAIIGKNCEIRHNAYLRENVIIGDGCVVGNSSELKNAWMFNGSAAPHFNYVGDSIIGYKTHLGAGVICSNLKANKENIWISIEGMPRDTGLRKFGALIGDEAEIGCNAVLNPGSIIGKQAIVYPNVMWREVLPDNMIAKNKAPVDVAVLRPRGLQ
jgi:NDP-sugar pyrophosphorylase family protein